MDDDSISSEIGLVKSEEKGNLYMFWLGGEGDSAKGQEKKEMRLSALSSIVEGKSMVGSKMEVLKASMSKIL